jgi:hypothetical protein
MPVDDFENLFVALVWLELVHDTDCARTDRMRRHLRNTGSPSSKPSRRLRPKRVLGSPLRFSPIRELAHSLRVFRRRSRDELHGFFRGGHHVFYGIVGGGTLAGESDELPRLARRA